MPSDPHNLIMAIGLISSLSNVTSSRDVPFHQPQQLQCSHHGLPKITFVLLFTSFLSPLAQMWQFAVHALWLRCETRVSAEPAGALQMLFFAWNTFQHNRTARSKTKPWPSDTPTLKSINEAHTLMVEHFVYFLLWLDFYFSCCSHAA